VPLGRNFRGAGKASHADSMWMQMLHGPGFGAI